MSVKTVETTAKAAKKKAFNFGQFYGKYGIFIILAVIFAVAAVAVPGFFSKYNLTNVLLSIACTTVLALGATFVIILGNINIAYGSELAFIGCIACMVDVATGSMPLALLAALAIGLLLGISSVLLMSRLNSGVPGAGVSYEMDAITAVVVGGTSMSGGSGTLFGTIVGAIIVGIINNVQTLMGVDSNMQKIVKGCIIVAAVIIDVVTKNSAKKAR